MRSFLKEAEIDEAEVFYATAVLCLPRDSSQRPARPTLDQTKNCTKHVDNLLRILQPKLIIPIGHTAVQSVQWIFHDWTELRQFILRYDVGNVLEKNGIAVYPLFPTSRSTLRARPQERQVRDWKKILSIFESLGVEPRSRRAPSRGGANLR
jgi:uracil-DNA glycosylase family 4